MFSWEKKRDKRLGIFGIGTPPAQRIACAPAIVVAGATSSGSEPLLGVAASGVSGARRAYRPLLSTVASWGSTRCRVGDDRRRKLVSNRLSARSLNVFWAGLGWLVLIYYKRKILLAS